MHGYPRPQLRRRQWTSLNGPWRFAIDADARWSRPEEVVWDRTIEVPFSPEAPRSGVGDTSLFKACWYSRTIEAEALEPRERLILRFGAVDYEADVWLDGALVAHHEGGYTPFGADLTELVSPGKTHTLVVRAHDDPADLAKPRGKQDWRLEPHSIWYPRTTGIWQTVWMERLADTHVAQLRWTPDLDRWEVGLEAFVVAPTGEPLVMHVVLRAGDQVLADDRYSVIAGEVHRRLALSDPGIDDFRNDLLWSPEKPTLIEASLTLEAPDGRVVDEVESYTALRSVSVQHDHVILNGRPYLMRLVLDQGYWPETGLTAPDDGALRADVEIVKQMGFNGVRKHQKIEDPRYHYWADRLGLLVWEEMPSAYRFTHRSIERVTREWLEVLRRDASHPCIVAWVPFNESWGVPNLPNSAPERNYVRALYHLTRTLDPTRPVVGNDGWESVATDIIGIHDYDPDPARIARRYGARAARAELLSRGRPGGRLLVVEAPLETHGGPVFAPHAHPIVLSEFGGICLAEDPQSTWGYSRCRSADELARRYRELMQAVGSLETLAGFCYTQLTDTYQEANGLLYADRRPKFPLAEIRRATRSGVRAGLHVVEASQESALTERDGAPR
jgi:beta-galactosidase/beta-glucuronidase